jgi:beta-galactosidase
MKLGVCYYPEHWPEDFWATDARRMAALGISRVRVGEFAWSRLEPEPGRFDWGWLDRAIETLGAAGLGVILGTPTATPPKWLVDRTPDMLAHDRRGQPRRFGSRRHYCFSSDSYLAEAVRITTELARRYGQHPALAGWQTDNEYGCHDTVVSTSPMAAAAFRRWCADRYGSVAALNAAWGTVFWSQEYRDFEEVDPPFGTVTEANPQHRLAWQRFASDEVATFNRAQVAVLRALSPGRDITHNAMGFFTEFDHHDLARDLDLVTWDSYPLGFLDQGWDDADTKARYLRQGHPDFAGFHHDLYRGLADHGRFGVMEQQPGPVNWAPWNPAPLSGMVRLWTLEAFAHGAELLSYFRWRQAPFAQEAMHAGLLRPDSEEDVAAGEVRAAAADLAALGAPPVARSAVAMLLDYPSLWQVQIQPQGRDYDPLRLVFETYTALRELGQDVDIRPSSADLTGYRLVVAPVLPLADEGLADRLRASGAVLVFGPRTGSKTPDGQIPSTLPPGALASLLPLRVTRVESLRPGARHAGPAGGVSRWIEHVETALPVRAADAGGQPLWFGTEGLHYVAGWPDRILMAAVLKAALADAVLQAIPLPDGVRIRRRGPLALAFNYGSESVDLGGLAPAPESPSWRLGTARLPAAGVAAWRHCPDSSDK